MYCYECFEHGIAREAVGLCHHCSAAVCGDHASVFADPMTTVEPLAKTVVLPKAARLLLCCVCADALRQTGVLSRAGERV